MTGNDRIIRKLLDRIHGIISTDVDKCFDIKLIQDAENLFIHFCILMNRRQFIAAGTQECSRGTLQKLFIQLCLDMI